ncbi:MAG: transposase zinc-binding domain-containing protein [Deltaproteobacteria bacterium]|nr:transposase zinc-binding domain-containing protein [Deltaproteobacteria bacterium]
MVQVPCSERHSSTGKSKRPKLELADIFRKHGTKYQADHDLSGKQHSVMFDIEHCRTSQMGYHVDVCTEWKIGGRN